MASILAFIGDQGNIKINITWGGCDIYFDITWGGCDIFSDIALGCSNGEGCDTKKITCLAFIFDC